MNPVVIGDAQLYLGDCREILPTLDKVDSVVTDPPYETEAHTLQRRVKRGTHISFEPISFEPISFELRELCAQEVARLVKRWALIFCQCEASQLWRKALEPMRYKRTAIWVKPDAMPQYSGDRPGMGYESLVCCHAEGRSTWNGGGRVGVFVHNKNSGGKHEHETQKPESLMRELLILFSDVAETILDPFMGSGTTGVACANLGRKFIGIEMEPKYFDIACKRIEQAYAQGRFEFDEQPKPEQSAIPL